MRYVLAIDEGTTGATCLMIGEDGRVAGRGYREIPQYFPEAGHVEHDALEILACVQGAAHDAIDGARARPDVIGITNQRETIVVWNRSTGDPIHRAIVWQDRRTAGECARLKTDGAEEMVRERSGLLLDPYFSATKIAWILDNVAGARASAERGELACGTIDSFLLWRLTGGAVHATDITNASRTSLFDIRQQCWDAELCRLFRVPGRRSAASITRPERGRGRLPPRRASAGCDRRSAATRDSVTGRCRRPQR